MHRLAICVAYVQHMGSALGCVRPQSVGTVCPLVLAAVCIVQIC